MKLITNESVEEKNWIRSFLIEHLKADIDGLSRALNKNKDEVFIFIHLFLRQLLMLPGIRNIMGTICPSHFTRWINR